jgi:hypothetical protein
MKRDAARRVAVAIARPFGLAIGLKIWEREARRTQFCTTRLRARQCGKNNPAVKRGFFAVSKNRRMMLMIRRKIFC